jgi:hypothetical protein
MNININNQLVIFFRQASNVQLLLNYINNQCAADDKNLFSWRSVILFEFRIAGKSLLVRQQDEALRHCRAGWNLV